MCRYHLYRTISIRNTGERSKLSLNNIPAFTFMNFCRKKLHCNSYEIFQDTKVNEKIASVNITLELLRQNLVGPNLSVLQQGKR